MTDGTPNPVPPSGAPGAAGAGLPAPAVTFPHPSAPKPPEARRARRADVARRLLAGEGVKAILAAVSAAHGVSATTVRQDVRRVVRAWAREDSRDLALRRSRVVRRLEANANACRKAKDWMGERQALALLARLFGMVGPSVSIDARSVSVSTTFDPAPWRRLAADPVAREAALSLLAHLANKPTPTLPDGAQPAPVASLPAHRPHLNGASRNGV